MKKCPLCNGTGYTQPPSETENKIFYYRKWGMTIRQIAKLTGKGSTTVYYHLQRAKTQLRKDAPNMP